MANSKINKHRIEGLPGIYIWGDPDKLDLYFKSGKLVSVENVQPAMVNVTVPGRTRHRYPGDPLPVTQRGHTRKMAGAGDARRVALPGRPFQLELRSTPDGVLPVKYERRQFGFEGNFTQFRVNRKDYLEGNVVLRSPTGRAWDPAPTTVIP